MEEGVLLTLMTLIFFCCSDVTYFEAWPEVRDAGNWMFFNTGCWMVVQFLWGFLLGFTKHYFSITKIIRDRSIDSAIKPKFVNQFFVANLRLFLFWFAELTEQFQVNNLYEPHKSTKNRLSNLKKLLIYLVLFSLYNY